MLVIVIKFILIVTFIVVLIQDIKDRLVYWFLFPIIGLCCALLNFNATLPELFLIACAINFGFILILLLMMYLYSKLKLGSKLKDVFGLGDVLLFFALIFKIFFNSANPKYFSDRLPRIQWLSWCL